MSARRRQPIACSEAELRSATADLADAHHETFPKMRDHLDAWADDVRSQVASIGESNTRRGFLIGGGTLAGAALLAACSSGGSSNTPPTTAGPSSTTGGSGGSDAAVAATAASIENLAVAAYAMGIQAATAGKLGPVPPAVVTFATTAKSQHDQHNDAFNAVVTASGQAKYTQPDPALLPTVQTAFAKVTDVTGLAMLALSLEDTAANTYLNDLAMPLRSQQLIAALSTIQPVERMHAAILRFVLGEYPVPDTFESANTGQPDGARPPTDINGGH